MYIRQEVTHNMAKILIVDDDVDIQETTRLFLEAAGFEVATAGNRREGMQAVNTYGPDLILLDVMMEDDDDGFTMAQDLRRDGVKTPIIMLTSVCKAFGMPFGKDPEMVPVDEFLEKPVKPDVLVSRIQQLLAR